MSKTDLTSLLSQLDVQSYNNQHSEVSSTCLKLLASGCSNKPAVLRQCITALIKQDKYQQCLAVLQEHENIEGPQKMLLEKLYVYYKLNKSKAFDDLYSTIASSMKDVLSGKNAPTGFKRGLLHVRSQFCYKVGKNNEAFEIYQFLASHNSDLQDNEVELACNERAPLAYLPKLESSLVTQLNKDSYDLLFNESLLAIVNGRGKLSLQLLENAKVLALNEGNDDDVSAIELQTAYVNQVSGNNTESKNILRKLVSKLNPQSTMYLLALNNLKSFNDLSKYTTNFSLLLRELNTEKINSSSQNFTQDQWLTLQSNLLFLNLFNNSSIQAKNSMLSRTLSAYQKVVDNVALDPYQTQARKLYHYCITAMSCGISGSIVGILLLAVQLQVIEKEWERAIYLCEYFLNRDPQSLAYEQRVVCYILFELYQVKGRDHSRDTLLSHLFDKFTIEAAKDDPQFWKFVGFKFLAQESTQNANAIFSELLSILPDDYLLLSVTNPSEGEQLSSELESLIDSIDVQKLVELGSAPFESKTAKTSNQTLKRVRKSKRVHKNRIQPKSFDADKLPNPERWLSLRDRSDYRPNKKQLAKQTQGGASNRKADQSLDISKKKQAKNGKKRR